MTIRITISALLALWLWKGWVAAQDATPIDRSIAKEPIYQSKQLEYWLLVVGLEAKTRVWLVRDGDALYVDRNGDGDITGADERVPFMHGGLAESLRVTAGRTSFTIVSLHTTEAGRYYVKVEVDGKRLQYASVKPSARRQDATVLHFDGPLEMALAYTDPSRQPIKRGSKSYDYSVLVTTKAPSQDGTWGPVVDHDKYVPTGVHPVAEFTFASKRPGGEPVKSKAVMDQRC